MHWSLIPNLMHNALNSFDDDALVSASTSGVDHLINLLGVYVVFTVGQDTFTEVILMNEFLYVEKYRPQTIDDTILPENLKETFKDFV